MSRSRRERAIAAVSLDIDDTLLDSESAARAGLRALVGTERAWPVWRSVTERHEQHYFAGEFDFDTMRVRRTRAFFAEFGEHIDDAEADRRERVRAAAMRRAWRLFGDARPCLDWLRANGMRLAVVTNAPGQYQRAKIEALGLAGCFDALVISGEIGVRKPDPRIFRGASEALGLAPERIVHIGDRLSTDALGSGRAGMRGVWLNRARAGHPPPAVPMISSLRELPLLITGFAAGGGLPAQRTVLAGAHG
ncbi:HAD family hydrolase [Salinifilum aidingensis]